MDAKVKNQGHKVTHDENAQSAENLVNATISKSHDIVKIMTQYTLHTRVILKIMRVVEYPVNHDT